MARFTCNSYHKVRSLKKGFGATQTTSSSASERKVLLSIWSECCPAVKLDVVCVLAPDRVQPVMIVPSENQEAGHPLQGSRSHPGSRDNHPGRSDVVRREVALVVEVVGYTSHWG